MRVLGLRLVCGAVLSALAWNAITPSTFARGCACGRSNQGIVYASTVGEDPVVLGPESLLDQQDNPAEIINLSVVVQDKAIVIINGEPTFTTGTVRNYIVRGLGSGKRYNFKIEGILKNEFGAEFAAKQEITIAAGESKQVVLQLRRRNRAKPPADPQLPPPVLPVAAAK